MDPESGENILIPSEEDQLATLSVGEEWTITFGGPVSAGATALSGDAWQAPIARLHHRDGELSVTLPREYVWLRTGDAFAVVVDDVLYAQARRSDHTGIYRIVPGPNPTITLMSRPQDDTFWWEGNETRRSRPVFVVDTDHLLLYVATRDMNASGSDTTARGSAENADVTVLVTPDGHHQVMAHLRLPIWNGPTGDSYLADATNGEVLQPTLRVTEDDAGVNFLRYALLGASRLDWRTTAIVSTDTHVIGIDTQRTFHELYRPADMDPQSELRTASIDGYGMITDISLTPGDTIAFTLNGTSHLFEPSSFTFQR